MHVKHQACSRVVRIRDSRQRLPNATVWEGPGGLPAGARERDKLRPGVGPSDSGDGGLHRGSPAFDRRHVVGFVHQAKEDPVVTGVLFGNLAPNVCELLVRGTAWLADDGAIPARVVVHVHQTVRAGTQAVPD